MLEGRSRWADIWHVVKRNPMTLVGAGIVLFYMVVAVAAPWISPYKPEAIDLSVTLSGPTGAHLFGTDALGRDILSQVIYASRIDLLIGLSAVMIALVIGVVLGTVSGYFGGWVDEALMRLMDVIQSFPAFILALGIVAVLGSGPGNIILVIAMINVPAYARLLRAELLAARGRQYAEAARVVGNSHSRIMFRHLLPNCLTPVIVIASINVGWAILITAGLSFLGVGIQPPAAEWGQMISSGTQEILSGAWWTSVFPGAALFVVVLGFNLVGDGLRTVLDPRSW